MNSYEVPRVIVPDLASLLSVKPQDLRTKVLYHVADKTEFNAEDFHAACDGQGANFVLIEEDGRKPRPSVDSPRSDGPAAPARSTLQIETPSYLACPLNVQ